MRTSCSEDLSGTGRYAKIYAFERAHNPEVAGSNPAPATKNALVRAVLGRGFLHLGATSNEF